MLTIKTTASELAKAIWGGSSWWSGFQTLNRGVYEGTSIPWRKVPAEARLVLHVARGGGRVEDFDGGWIADRFGPELGRRDVARAVKKLAPGVAY